MLSLRTIKSAAGLGLAVLLACLSSVVLAGPAEGEKVDMAAMMARAQKMTATGPKHALLKRFIGVWDLQFRITMPGGESEPTRGVATFEWLIEDRWISQKSTGSLMGMKLETFGIIGYDNFKMSYVTVSVSSLDTAMLYSEGDLDQHGKALLSYGTLDEYLTGEHDKMVKYIWRFLSEDEMVFEVHDLPIGETNTKVIEVTYNRRETES